MNKIPALIDAIHGEKFYRNQIHAIHEVLEVKAVYSGASEYSPGIQRYLDASGIKSLYCHQAEAILKIRAGKNTVITTPTASGKTLAFNIPVLEAIEKSPDTRALYIYPAKALANDQLKVLDEMGALSKIAFESGIYDGDTPQELKKAIRDNSNIIITNPYELHHVLPYHSKWKTFYKNLKYVVLDEAHRYKGIFGSNIAFLIRRLKRILRLYGATPQFIVSTASIANALEFTEKLTGEAFELVDKNGAPSGRKDLVMWDSSEFPDKSVHTQTKDLLLYTVKNDFQTLVFTGSRRMAELIRMWAEKESKGEAIRSYRAGYSPELRRELEKQLKEGTVKGVVSTNALELGIDIGQLDIIIISGYPGSISSFWQQSGRAGRKMQESAVFFLPHEDALEKYILRNPDILLSKNFENAIISLENPNIITGHVLCALSEAPSPTDKIFPDIDTAEAVTNLLNENLVTKTPRGYIYSGSKRPQDAVSLDSIGASEIKIKIDGRILETVGIDRALNEAYPKAVYLHNGETYIIKELNIESGTASAVKETVDYYTDPVKDEDVKILNVKKEKEYGRFKLHFGDVSVTEHFKGFRTKKAGKVLSQEEMALPPSTFTTEAVWITLDDSIRKSIKDAALDFDGAIHACEHALIALAPLFAMCDRNDIGGRSYPMYPGSGESEIFIYDGYEGGIGIAEKLFDIFPALAVNTYHMVKGCSCEEGCPNCVYSPKCGNNNSPIDKRGAVVMLGELK